MTNLLDRLGPFKGNLEDGLIHNWLLAGKPTMPGSPVAITCDAAKALVGMDLTLQRVLDDNVNVKGVGIVSLQGIGKTFTAYKFCYTWSGEDVGGGIAGINIDSLKHNNSGRPETAPLVTDLLGSTVIEVMKIRLNALSKLWDLTFTEQYTMVSQMIQVDSNRRLKAKERNVLDACLRICYDSENPSFMLLSQILRKYLAPTKANAPEGYAGKLYRPWQAKSIEKAAFALSEAVDNLSTATYGEIFKDADDEQLLKLIEQRAKSWDFKGVGDTTRSVIEIFRGTIEMSALAQKDPDNPKSGPKHPERLAQFIVRDEAYNAWKNAFFADAELLRMKTLREHDITVVMCFQHLSDFLRVVGSAAAREVIKEIPIWLIGRQHKKDLPDLREFLDLPEHVLRTLTTLAKGHFWLIMPGRAPVLIFILGTEEEIKHFVTNEANLAKLQRYFETHDTKYYVQWLEETSPEVEEPDAEGSDYDMEELREEAVQV